MQFFKKLCFQPTCLKQNALALCHWIKCLTLLQEEDRPTDVGDSVSQKLAELDLFQEAALLIPKVRLSPNILRIQSQGVNGYITSPYITLWGLQHCHQNPTYPLSLPPLSHSFGSFYDILTGSNHHIFKIPSPPPPGPIIYTVLFDSFWYMPCLLYKTRRAQGLSYLFLPTQ